MNIDSYLARVGYRGTKAPRATVLRDLHRMHMFSVPFENLDIGMGRMIVCDESRFLHKIVDQRRGGFCYELNGAFAALLRALGFDVTLLSCCVARPDGSEGPEFDHMALLVNLEHQWLADVGFGDSFVEPLRLETGSVQQQASGMFRIDQSGDRFTCQARRAAGWKPQYSFSLQSHPLSDFAEMCHYHQTSPDSHFTRNSICSLATPEGRITLAGEKLIETRGPSREERLIGAEERDEILRYRFGITLRT